MVSLLPSEHASALDAPALAASTFVRARFLTSGRALLGHSGKAVKGRLARLVFEEDLRAADLPGVSLEGFVLDESSSVLEGPEQVVSWSAV